MNKDYPIHSLDDIFNDPDAQQLLVKKQQHAEADLRS